MSHIYGIILGDSGVGKTSLINCMLNQKDTILTSTAASSTYTIDFQDPRSLEEKKCQLSILDTPGQSVYKSRNDQSLRNRDILIFVTAANTLEKRLIEREQNSQNLENEDSVVYYATRATEMLKEFKAFFVINKIDLSSLTKSSLELKEGLYDMIKHLECGPKRCEDIYVISCLKEINIADLISDVYYTSAAYLEEHPDLHKNDGFTIDTDQNSNQKTQNCC